MRDFFESPHGRGRTSPAAATTALACRSDALGVYLPLRSPALAIATSAESNGPPKKAPSMTMGAVSKLERAASGPEVPTPKRIFAANVVLMAYASLRFPDARHIKDFPIPLSLCPNKPTLMEIRRSEPSRLQKQRRNMDYLGQGDCPEIGIAWSSDWVTTICNFREAFKKKNGRYPSPPQDCIVSSSGIVWPYALRSVKAQTRHSLRRLMGARMGEVIHSALPRTCSPKPQAR